MENMWLKSEGFDYLEKYADDGFVFGKEPSRKV